MGSIPAGGTEQAAMSEQKSPKQPEPFAQHEKLHLLSSFLETLEEHAQLAHIQKLVESLTESKPDAEIELQSAQITNEHGQTERRRVVLKYREDLNQFVLEDKIGAGYLFSTDSDIQKLLFAFNVTINQDMVNIFNDEYKQASDSMSDEEADALMEKIKTLHYQYITTYQLELLTEFVQILIDQLHAQKAQQISNN